MYAEAEPIVEGVARALTMGGSFYCTYTNAGGRLRIIHDRLTSGRDDAVSVQIGILLAGYLHRCGVFHTTGSRVRMLDLEDLLRICRMFGLHYVAQPDLKEGPGPYLGIPGTFDFMVRKRRPHAATRALARREKAGRSPAGLRISAKFPAAVVRDWSAKCCRRSIPS